MNIRVLWITSTHGLIIGLSIFNRNISKSVQPWFVILGNVTFWNRLVLKFNLGIVTYVILRK